jgi:hypothetical protein
MFSHFFADQSTSSAKGLSPLQDFLTIGVPLIVVTGIVYFAWFLCRHHNNHGDFLQDLAAEREGDRPGLALA